MSSVTVLLLRLVEHDVVGELVGLEVEAEWIGFVTVLVKIQLCGLEIR
jgi:hypothetical protein